MEAIQGWLVSSPNPGEAIVRQAIVLRLLHAAGFDIWDPAEVVPEETNATGNRSDFLIRAGQGKFALEIKGMNITLGAQQFQQASTYAVNEGTRWAIVTNGRVWIAIDEHLPGRWEERVALKLELGQEGHTFADDLAALLDAETWRSDNFASAVEGIKSRQQQRLDEARIRREKTAVVKDIQKRYRIPTFDLAAEAAVEMNALTEAERDVLLGVATQARVSPTPRKRTTPPQPEPVSEPMSDEFHFTYQTLGAVAHAVYRPAKKTWTVKAGSTIVPTVKAHATGVEKRRAQLLEDGHLVQQDGQFIYAADVVYSSPSTAAVDISGASRNGWDCWKDSEGRPAQHYRPQ